MVGGGDTELTRGERRIITVLFADIVGSTEHIGDLDPEDAQEFLDEILHRMIENIHAHGGAVTQTLGDGVMAVFGAPAANEDHALCACLAGIAIRDSLEKAGEKPAGVRVGIHSGPAIIRWGGNDFGRELKSVGSTVHVAARIEKMCPENGVAISAVTFELTGAQVKSRKVGSVRDGGEDVAVVELVSIKPKDETDRRIRGRAPNRLVGRRAELAEINRVIRGTQEGRTESIAFVGEAGLGKSRLEHEVQLRAIRTNMACETIRGFAANTATPFAALRPMALRLLGPGEAEGEAIFARLRDVGLERRESLGLLALAGRPLDGDADWRALAGIERNRAIIDGAVRALLARARMGPLLVVVEDVHFLDKETVGFLRHVAALRAKSPFGLVVTTRPEKLAFARDVCGRVIELKPLEPASARKLAEAEIGGSADEQEAATIDAVVSRAGGIPLALEEFARMMGTARATRQNVPISIENAFNTRLGQLPPTAREVAEAASVLGGEFDLDVLRQTAGVDEGPFYSNLITLVHQRFLELIDDKSARFSHQLMQEACYAFTAKARRQSIHRTAHSVSMASADPRHRVAQELARHAIGAGDPTQGLKHLWDACVVATGQAAIHSIVSLYRQAKSVCDEIGEAADLDAAKFTLLVFDAFQQLGDQEELVAALEAARRAMRASGNERGAVQADIHLAMSHWIAGRHKQGLEVAQSASVGAKPFLPLQVYSEFALGNLEFANGHAIESTDRLRRLIDMLSGDMATTRFGVSISIPGAMARAFASWYLSYIGAFEEAERYQTELAETAQRLNHQYSRLLSQIALGFRLWQIGDSKGAVDALAIAHDLAWTEDFHGLESCVSAFYAQTLLECGRIGAAQAVLARSLAFGNHEKTRNVNLYYLRETQAKLHVSLGDLDAALASAIEAISVAEANYDPIHRAHGLFSKALVHLSRSEPDLARAELEAAVSEANRLGLAPLAARAAAKLAPP